MTTGWSVLNINAGPDDLSTMVYKYTAASNHRLVDSISNTGIILMLHRVKLSNPVSGVKK